MKRRDFIRITTAAALGCGLNAPQALAQLAHLTSDFAGFGYDANMQDYLLKMRNFDKPHSGDIFVEAGEVALLQSCAERLGRLELVVGYGFFHLLSFDDALRYSRNYSRIGAFTDPEINFMEKVFYRNAQRYGFLDDKPLKNLTHVIPRNEVVRIARTGNFLHRGDSLKAYQKIKKPIGNRLVLTSGVRGIMKQYRLFLNKAYQCGGNLSLASRQVAPPGYSFHGFNDFDVGQAGFGEFNFTERFTGTEACRRLADLGLLNLRYPRDNLLGVRYEPWHIMVSAGA
jgi:D-alanyl-D-alanine carboxypeptidase